MSQHWLIWKSKQATDGMWLCVIVAAGIVEYSGSLACMHYTDTGALGHHTNAHTHCDDQLWGSCDATECLTLVGYTGHVPSHCTTCQIELDISYPDLVQLVIQ